jgi:chloride channel protein, CIC family
MGVRRVTEAPNVTTSPAEMRTRTFWRVMGYAAVLGVVGAVSGILFLGVTGVGETWYGEPGLDWFDGPVWWVGVAAVAGLIVGILRRVLDMPQKAPGLVEDLQSERVAPMGVPAVVAVSAISIIGGASLGPEVALGQVGGGSGGLIAERRGLDEDDSKALALSGMAGAFGGLFSSPLVAMALVTEVAHPPRQRWQRMFFGSLVATSISFGVYFAIIGSVFLGIYTVPTYDYQDWHLLAGVGLGVVSAGVVLVTVAIVTAAHKLFARLPINDLLKPVIGGVVFGIVAVVVPLTLFTGSSQLETVLTNAGTLGLAMLLAILFGKMVAFAVSSATGFIGGPIFPVLFLGGTSGVIVNQLLPDVPIGLAFTCMLAAVPGAIVSAPFSLVLLAALLTQVGALQTAPVLIAVGTASLLIAAIRSIISERGGPAVGPASDPS